MGNHASKKLTEEQKFCQSLAYDFKYFCEIQARFEQGECGFCTLDSNINVVIYENEHWLVFENAFKNTRPNRVMLVIISRQHWRKLSQITKADAWATFGQAIGEIEKRFKLPGGMLFLRFGDMRLNAGTMQHLHWNLWVPDRRKGKKTGSYIPMVKTAADRKKDIARWKGFQKRYEAGERA